MKTNLVGFDSFKGRDFDMLLTIDIQYNWFEHLCGLKDGTRQFYGHSTVWYSWPQCKRAGTHMEGILCNYAEYVEAHELLIKKGLAWYRNDKE